MPTQLFAEGDEELAVALQSVLAYIEKVALIDDNAVLPPFAPGLGFLDWSRATAITHFLGCTRALEAACEALDPVALLVEERPPSLDEYRKACVLLRACRRDKLDSTESWKGVSELVAHTVLGASVLGRLPDLRALGLSFGSALELFQATSGPVATCLAHALLLQKDAGGDYFWTSPAFEALSSAEKTSLCDALHAAADIAPRPTLDDRGEPAKPRAVKELESAAELRRAWRSLAEELPHVPAGRYIFSTRGAICAAAFGDTRSAPDITIGGTMALTIQLKAEGRPPAKIEVELNLKNHYIWHTHEGYEVGDGYSEAGYSVCLKASKEAWPEGGPVFPPPPVFADDDDTNEDQRQLFAGAEAAMNTFEQGLEIDDFSPKDWHDPDKPNRGYTITNGLAECREIRSFFVWWLVSWERALAPGGATLVELEDVHDEYALATSASTQRVVTLEELGSLLESGQATAASYVCPQDGKTTTWKRIDQLPGLHEALSEEQKEARIARQGVGYDDVKRPLQRGLHSLGKAIWASGNLADLAGTPWPDAEPGAAVDESEDESGDEESGDDDDNDNNDNDDE